ncbi:AraC family transcriptional regulator [Clostridium bowmanii]|uniref:AraC family transcriptional regulator n=1 Tax=Clostridium bowmanii TaxID=132925 RepID=UPI001C0C08FB|nr:helix-turn-helix domain-containing protein [Clostridium bowmanii]MBU3191014.1 AraC family transcriptional regulator [Clostridium bowmanii]MCA1075336.1 AraC family transcriptional regulator [Clostridium bowmanii]
MKHNISKFKNTIMSKFFRNNLILFIVVSILPLFIVSTSTYYIGISQIEKEVNKTHKLQLDHVFQNMDKQLNLLQSTFNRWSFYPAFNDEFKKTNLSLNFSVTQSLYNVFDLLKSFSPLIENVTLYLDNQQVLLSNKGIYYLNENSNQSYYNDLLKNTPTIFWTNNLSAVKNNNEIAMSLVQKIPGGTSQPYGFFYVTLNQAHIKTMVEELNPDNQGAAFILNSTGKWLTYENDINNSTNSLDGALRSEVIKIDGASGSFAFSFKNKRYAVTYGTFDRTGWKYVVATPLSKLTEPATLLSRTIIYISLFVLTLALLLSWFASNRLYKPIKRLVSMFAGKNEIDTFNANQNEMNFLENSWINLSDERLALVDKVEKNSDSLREGFMLQLVQGHLCFISEKELKDQMSQYFWNPEGKYFSLLLVSVEINKQPKSKFALGDENLLTFSVANILKDLCHDKWGQSVIINFHNLTVAVILTSTSTDDVSVVKSKSINLSNIIVTTLTKVLQVNVFVVLGKTVANLKQISTSLDEALQGLRYPNFDKQDQVIIMDNLIPQGNYKSNYPFSIENSIINSIGIGMKNETLEFIKDFMKKLKSNMDEEFLFRQGMLQLLGRILETFLKSGLNMKSIYKGSNLYEQLSNLNNSDEILNWFDKTLISPYAQEIDKTKEKHIEHLIENVLEIINCEYSQPISLDFCANSQGITSYTLSKMFKKLIGVNFIDYLTQVRIKHAKDLLSRNNLKVSDIAEKVGYQPGYFVRTFKKLEGMTPGQYQELHNKEK